MKDEKQKGTNVFAAAMQKTKELGEKAAENAKAVGRKVADGAKAGAEAAAQGAAELGKKVADGAKAGADVAAQNWAEFSKRQEEAAKLRKERAADAAWQRDMAKYNPLFWDDYISDGYTRPSLIMIRNEVERRGIEVCEDAIGWTEKVDDAEVLCLYDKALEASGITFVPVASVGELYCEDQFDRTKYISVGTVFSQAHEERISELKEVARSLGAKYCCIEISESTAEAASHDRKAEFKVKAKGANTHENIQQKEANATAEKRSGRIEAFFEGSAAPKRPVLKWFAHSNSIRKLIDARCSEENRLYKETIEINGSSSATMSQQLAASIDGALGKVASVKGSASMAAKASKEHNSTLYFHIEF